MGGSPPHSEAIRKLAALTDIKGIAEAAGIPPAAICDPNVNAVCGPFECEWVREHFSADHSGLSGLLYTGASATVDARMNALVGCFIRNFVTARKMPVGRVMTDLENDNPPQCDLLCIPDFFLGEAAAMAPAQMEMLYGLLTARQSQSRKSVLYVPSLNEVRIAYGPEITNFLDLHFLAVGSEDVPTT